VFLNSRLTNGVGPAGNAVATGSSANTTLARSAGNGSWDNVVFVNTKMDSHITAAGWLGSPVSNPATATASSGWREYNSMKLDGTALDVSGRSSMSRQLSAAEAAPYLSRAAVFSAIGWTPSP
jgi:hypothetical protein